MSQRTSAILLLIGLFYALLVRVIIPFHSVFTPSEIILNTPDAYFMLRYADMFPNYPTWDYFINYPIGTGGFNYLVFPSLIAIIAKFFSVSTLLIASVLPVMLFYMSIIPLYVVSRILFNQDMAVLSTLVYCLIPGEFLNRTTLGAADYHCWELFLVSWIMMAVIISVKYYKNPIYLIYWSFSAVIGMILYYLSWQGSMLISLILLISIGLFVFLRLRAWVYKWLVVLVYSLIALVVYFKLRWLFLMGTGIFLPRIETPVSEEMPLFFTSGQFELSTMWNNYGINFYLALFGLGILIYMVYKYKNLNTIIFCVWSLVILAMTLAMRRFAYYAAFNIAILVPLCVVIYYRFYYRNSALASKVKYYVATILIVCGLMVSIGIQESFYNPYAPSKDLQNVARWLRSQWDQQTELRYGVFARYGDSYYLLTMGHQAIIGFPGHWGAPENALWINDDNDYVISKLKERGIKYIVINDKMLSEEFSIMNTTARIHGLKENPLFDDTFMWNVYYGIARGTQQVYNSGNMKVFEIE